MKKLVALLMCLITVLSLFSCDANDQKTEAPATTNTASPTPNDVAMQMYESAIKDEICVVDERLGEVKLKSLRFASNNTSLGESKLLKKAILDVDRDGANEYVIQSPNSEHIILHCSNGKVYSYWLDAVESYQFNQDGSFYWYDSPEEHGYACGLSQITFVRETLCIKSLYKLQYSKNSTNYEYFVEGEAVTSNEYYSFRKSHYLKTSVKFSQFELACAYPVTAEQAWNLANAYWDYQDGCSDAGAGTVWTARIVLIDTPNSETDAYSFAFQWTRNTGGGQEGHECIPPHTTHEHDKILVNAFTGEITASTYDPSGKCLSIEEAIEIAKKRYGVDHDGPGSRRFEHDVNEPAPDHIYVISVYTYQNGSYSYYTGMWIDKYTGEIVQSYYVWGK